MAAKLSIPNIMCGVNLLKIYQELYLLDIKSCYTSEITFYIINKNYFDGRMNSWYELIFFRSPHFEIPQNEV